MRTLRYYLVVSMLLATAAGFASCGPSIRRTYQSDNAFERCFDMDYNPEMDAPAKQDCWTGWLADHVYNQPEDKTRYVEQRLEELDRGVSLPGPPGPPGMFDQRPEPPVVKGEEQDTRPVVQVPLAEDHTEDDAPDGGLPGAGCERVCKESRLACMGVCSDGEPCTGACNAGYRNCMKSCFGD